MKAVACFPSGPVQGEATFEDGPGGCLIQAFFTVLPPGAHGFHIHTNGDLRGEGCLGACAHFHKGRASVHGGPPGSTGPRHTGDLGNIEAVHEPYHYKLKGVNVDELLGRTLIVHADPDDLGQGSEEDSKTTGHSGKRIACAIIGRARECELPKRSKTRRAR